MQDSFKGRGASNSTDARKLLRLDWGFIDETFAPGALSACVSAAIANQGYHILQYGSSYGLPDLRRMALDFLIGTYSIQPGGAELCVTSGSTAGIDLVGRVILGGRFDSVVLEPVYDTALQSLLRNSRHVHGVAHDPFRIGGSIAAETWSELERHLIRADVRLLYIVPSFNNPTGVTIGGEDRARLLALCGQHRVVILEDDPYRPYCFEGSLPDSFFNLNSGSCRVIYINSLSKVFFPGVRIGFMLAEPEIIARVADLQKYTLSSPSLVMQGACCEALQRGLVSSATRHYVQAVRKKREEFMAAFVALGLGEWLELAPSHGGFYAWCRGRCGPSAGELLERAAQHGVSFVPGQIYFRRAPATCHLRLCYSCIALGDLPEALVRLRLALMEGR